MWRRINCSMLGIRSMHEPSIRVMLKMHAFPSKQEPWKQKQRLRGRRNKTPPPSNYDSRMHAFCTCCAIGRGTSVAPRAVTRIDSSSIANSCFGAKGLHDREEQLEMYACLLYICMYACLLVCLYDVMRAKQYTQQQTYVCVRRRDEF